MHYCRNTAPVHVFGANAMDVPLLFGVRPVCADGRSRFRTASRTQVQHEGACVVERPRPVVEDLGVARVDRTVRRVDSQDAGRVAVGLNLLGLSRTDVVNRAVQVYNLRSSMNTLRVDGCTSSTTMSSFRWIGTTRTRYPAVATDGVQPEGLGRGFSSEQTPDAVLRCVHNQRPRRCPTERRCSWRAALR